ncbi:MAG: lipoate-protein ligase B [Sphingobium sp.]|nr:lipoate-protein ligase B [Sphingobium sp.]
MTEAERHDIEWRVDTASVAYPDALAMMEARAAAVAAGTARELIWLLEHPPIYTAGTSADPAELIDPRFPVFETGRGGRYTYHGPGQRVGYLVLDLGKRGRDIRNFIGSLENWLIEALALIDVPAFAVPGRVGIWTSENGTEAKIGAIGVRVRRWVTMHGFSVNIATDLSDFAGIVPCGLPDYPVTSVKRLGKGGDSEAFDAALVARLGHFLDRLSLSSENEA